MSQIYVKLDGRLGNQFFQYAFARMIQSRIGGDLVLDFTSQKLNATAGFTGNDGLENHLTHFNVRQYKYIDLGNFNKYCIPKNQYHLFKIMRRLKPMTRRRWYVEIMEYLDHRLLQCFGIYFLESSNPAKYIKLPKKSKDIFVRGWFEGSCYFNEISDELRSELTPKHDIPENLIPLYKKIKSGEYICVSIRRGDFTSNAYSKRYLICTPEYYKRGIEEIRKLHPEAKVFVCSDDLDWCRKNVDFGEGTLFEPNGLPVWEKIRFMSACQHFVLSNSTFSWWCQFLSKSKNKIVVAPSVWRNDKPQPKEIFEKDWILIDTHGL